MWRHVRCSFKAGCCCAARFPVSGVFLLSITVMLSSARRGSSSQATLGTLCTDTVANSSDKFSRGLGQCYQCRPTRGGAPLQITGALIFQPFEQLEHEHISCIVHNFVSLFMGFKNAPSSSPRYGPRSAKCCYPVAASFSFPLHLM